jgi:hypothetical protein
MHLGTPPQLILCLPFFFVAKTQVDSSDLESDLVDAGLAGVGGEEVVVVCVVHSGNPHAAPKNKSKRDDVRVRSLAYTCWARVRVHRRMRRVAISSSAAHACYCRV